MVLAALLPFAVWILLALALGRRGRGATEALLLAAVMLGVVVCGITEGLQLVLERWARPGLLHAVWILLLTLAGAAAATPRGSPWPWKLAWPRDRVVLGLSAGLLALFVALLLVAFASPPNSWDVQCYHLPRMRMWLQQGHVAPYPSPDPRQLFMGALPSWFQLHLRVLAGNDRWANIPQLWAWVLSALAGAQLARALKADRRLQLVAATFAASLPMAVSQAATAMTDLAVSAWLAVAAALLFGHAFGVRRDRLSLAGGGAALGLAVLSKGTALILGGALGLGWVAAELCGGGWRAQRWRGTLVAVAAVLALTALPNAPGWARNVEAFGNPLAPTGQQGALLSEVRGPRYAAFNTLRAAVMQLGVPRLELSVLGDAAPEGGIQALVALSEDANEWLRARTVALGEAWGIPDGDPRISSTVSCGENTTSGCGELGQRFVVHPAPRSEETATNPLHFLLILGSLPLLAIARRPRGDVAMVGATLLLAALLFCGLVKWQVWTSRQILPLFVIGAPWAAVALARLGRPRLAPGLGVILLLAAAPYALQAEMRPLYGEGSVFARSRAELRFRTGTYLQPVFDELVIAAADREARELGLATRWSAPVYHAWTSFEDRGIAPPPIRYMDLPEVVAGDFALPASDAIYPDLILALFPQSFPERLRLDSCRFITARAWEEGVVLYRQELGKGLRCAPPRQP